MRLGGMNTTDPAQSQAHREGPIAKAIETQTAKLPSDTFLWAAFASIGLSLALKFSGRRHDALFVGQWAPTFLLLGIYNKLVKLHQLRPDRALVGGRSGRFRRASKCFRRASGAGGAWGS